MRYPWQADLDGDNGKYLGPDVDIDDLYKFPSQPDLDRDEGKYLALDPDLSMKNSYALQRSCGLSLLRRAWKIFFSTTLKREKFVL